MLFVVELANRNPSHLKGGSKGLHPVLERSKQGRFHGKVISHFREVNSFKHLCVLKASAERRFWDMHHWCKCEIADIPRWSMKTQLKNHYCQFCNDKGLYSSMFYVLIDVLPNLELIYREAFS